MPIISGHLRLRTGTDTARQAATLHTREPHITSDRREFWIGSELQGERSYQALAPDPSGGGYAISTTLAFPVRNRRHFARVAPVEYSGDYTHTLILPNAGATPPRNGDEAELYVILPACTAHTITLAVRNASISGTQLVQVASVVGDVARKWKLVCTVTGGAWELTGAQELVTF